MAGISVQPYWEVTFDRDGHPDPDERDALLRGAARENLTDLVLFAHGWNNTRSTATGLYAAFFAPFPRLLAGAGKRVRLGYGGVIWPSMRFTDEPVPEYRDRGAALAGPGLPPDARQDLASAFPGRDAVLDRLAELLAGRPADPARLTEFAGLVRTLVAPHPHEEGVQDTGADTAAPLMFTADAASVCERFADALESTGLAVGELFGGVANRVWGGALELLRQGTYWEMKRRAGVVGRRGLGPAVAALARSSPGLRVHLVGHSFGARLVSYALGGLPAHPRAVHSLTMLQGAFSHYAFAPRLPFAHHRSGPLHGLRDRVAGPVVCCHSRHDLALGVFYPLASRVSDDDDSLLGFDEARWGAMGHDGIRAVPGCAELTLGQGLDGALPDGGWVNLDASAVVRRGGPPAGAHSDICHQELARIVLLAGRVVR